MAFPANPIDGRISGKYKYSSATNSWRYINYLKVPTPVFATDGGYMNGGEHIQVSSNGKFKINLIYKLFLFLYGSIKLIY